jgi:hypothetical protein
LAAAFAWRCPSSVYHPPFPHPPHRTGRADLPHPALGQYITPSPTPRYPAAPGPSLTGVRLVVPDHAMGLPVLRMSSLCTCCRHYPGTATGGTALLDPFRRISLPRKGRPVGLCIVLFEACSAFTPVTACTLALSPYFVTRFAEGFSRFVTSTAASVASGGSTSPGGTCTHWTNIALSRRTP